MRGEGQQVRPGPFGAGAFVQTEPKRCQESLVGYIARRDKPRLSDNSPVSLPGLSTMLQDVWGLASQPRSRGFPPRRAVGEPRGVGQGF